MTAREAKELAERHWEWLEPLLHYLYVTAFMHGVKHQRGEGNKDDKVRGD